MEQIKSGSQSFLEGRFYSAVTILLTLVVTFAVCFTIAGQWKTYDWIKKLLAGVLLLNLGTVPIAIIVRLRKGKTSKSDISVQVAYTWLLLATILFNR